MQSIHRLLDELLALSGSADLRLKASLQPPLSRVDAQMALKAAGITLLPPDEWFAAYAWHNGTSGYDTDSYTQLFHYHQFMPVSEALEVHAEWEKFNSQYGAPGVDVTLLPMFAFSGEYYAIECSSEPTKHGRIHFDFQGDIVAYDSLESMLESIVECYRQGAYVSGAEDVVNSALAAKIKLTRNVCRREFLQHESHP